MNRKSIVIPSDILLIIKLDQLKPFINRWMKRANELLEKRESLNDFFDEFFTLYVIYNRLYNIVAVHSISVGLVKKKDQQSNHSILDGKAATIYIAKFLKEDQHKIITVLANEIKHLKLIISEERFHIALNNGMPDLKEDRVYKEKLSSNKPSVVFLSVLEVLYEIRCNVFHGEKSFEDRQTEILKTSNIILRTVIGYLVPRIEEMGAQHLGNNSSS